MNEEKRDATNKISIVIKFYNFERWLWTYLIFISSLTILFNCSIPPTANLKKGVNIAHGIGIVIHQNTTIGENTILYQNVTVGSGNGPQIGANCILGAGACVLGDIVIGNNVKIGANCVVLNDIPDNCTVVGVPGKIIKKNEKNWGLNKYEGFIYFTKFKCR